MHEHASAEGLDKHAGHRTEDFLRKFWVTAALSVPVILYSPILQTLFGWSAPTFSGSAYLPLALGSVVFFYGGLVFVKGARRELAARVPGMMTLIAMAVTIAYLWSVYASLAREVPLWWELSTLIAIMLLGHWIEMRAVMGAEGALRSLSKLLPDVATVRRDGRSAIVPLAELREGDLVLVVPGAQVPADGIVTEGESETDESMITGESKPVGKRPEDNVIAGTINGDGSLTVRVTHIGETTFLAGVMRLVAEAQASKSRLQILSDRAAFYLTVIATIAGVATLTAWLLAGANTSFAISRLVAVLVIACPHALGLAVPLVAAISTAKAAKNGFLVRKRIALEAARTIDTVLFDKTGTLTRGAFGVTGIWAAEGESEDAILLRAAALDAQSSHPIAKAVVAEARTRSLPLVEATGHTALKGRGARALLNGKETMIGGPALLAASALSIPPELSEQVAKAGGAGQTVIFVIEEGRVCGALALADVVREESRAAIAMLRSMGIRSAMITGDSEDVARAVATQIGLEEYFARILPEDKSAKVRQLQEAGRTVAMVGDGINDAPALSQADLGIAIGAGTNVAIESAGIILVRDDPRDIPKIIRLSRLTYMKMLQNLWWAAGYNIVAIPLAAGALAAWGIFLEPAFAAVLMSASTVIVAVNAMLLAHRPLS